MFRVLHADDKADVVLDTGADAVLVRAGLDQANAARLAELLNSLVRVSNPLTLHAVQDENARIIRFEG